MAGTSLVVVMEGERHRGWLDREMGWDGMDG